MPKKTIRGKTFYTLTYLIDGLVYFQEYVEAGVRLSHLVTVRKEHATFSGWGETPVRMPSRDLTIEGHLEIEKIHADFYVDTIFLGAVESEPHTPIMPLTPPEKEGFVFSHWSDFTGLMPEESCRYEAVYVPKVYDIRYILDQDLILHVKGLYGESCPILPDPKKEHYTFSGWDDIPTLVPNHDVEIHGCFIEKNYTLTFLVDGEVFEKQMLPYGAPIDKKIKPEKEGYYFSGWRKLPDTMPKQDLTVTASMYPARYLLQFVYMGHKYLEEYVPFGTTIVPPVVEGEKEQIFWNGCPKTMPAHSVCLIGSTSKEEEQTTENASEIAAPKKINVVNLFLMVDGQLYKQEYVTPGEPIPQFEAPKKPEMEFLRWEGMRSVMPEEPLVLRAIYQQSKETSPNEKVVVRLLVDGAVRGIFHLIPGTPLQIPTLPVEEYTHIKWKDAPALVPNENLDLYGTIVQDLFTVEYMQKGLCVHREEYVVGEVIHPTFTPENEMGFLFDGWLNLPSKMPAHNIQVQATFKEALYRVTFVLEDLIYDEQDLPIGAPVVPPVVPPKEGSSFSGWDNLIDEMPPYNFIVRGEYTPLLYTITYFSLGEEYLTQEYTFGENIKAPKEPYKEGLVFDIWEDLPSQMPACNLHISARYKGPTYRLSYVIDGKVCATEEYAPGSRILPLAPEGREGYAFLGWNALPEFMPQEELVVTGAYEERTHLVYFYVDGAIYRVYSYEKGTKIIPPQAPLKEHENFIKWRNFTDVMPSYDFSCFAEYKEAINPYKFILNNRILFEGLARKGDSISAPTVEYKSGYRFAGWNGFTGKMPGEPVIYMGQYIEDHYKLFFELDGVNYDIVDFDPGEPITIYPTPEKEGYIFSGWSKLPQIMPEDDVYVTGTMIPKRFYLNYIVDDQIIYQKELECGTPLHFVEGPKIHGKVFLGWDSEPDVMPPSDLTIYGSYKSAPVLYKKIFIPPQNTSENQQVEKKIPMMQDAVAFLSCGVLCVSIDGTTYMVRDSEKYIINSKVVDLPGLCRALKNLYRYFLISKRKLNLLVNAPGENDVLFDTSPLSLEMLNSAAQELFLHTEFADSLDFEFLKLSTNPEYGTERVLASSLNHMNCASITTAFKMAGVSIASYETLTSSLVSYLQYNRSFSLEESQLVFFMMPNSIMMVLLIGGQVSFICQNEYPYDKKNFDLESELQYYLNEAARYYEDSKTRLRLKYVCVGGIDRPHTREVERHILKLVRQRGEDGQFGGLQALKGLKLVTLGFCNSNQHMK